MLSEKIISFLYLGAHALPAKVSVNSRGQNCLGSLHHQPETKKYIFMCTLHKTYIGIPPCIVNPIHYDMPKKSGGKIRLLNPLAIVSER